MNLTPKNRVLASLTHTLKSRSDTLVVDWNLGNTCNYSCSYCPAHLHDGSLSWQSGSDVLRTCESIIDHFDADGRKIFFQFTGGEPTLWNNFSEVAQYIVERNGTVGIISNGTRGLDWWEANLTKLRAVTLTYHIEFTRRDKFMKLVDLVNEHTVLHVNVTMVPEHFTQCLEIANELYEHHQPMSLTAKPLLKGFGTELYDYTADQIQQLSGNWFYGRSEHDDRKARGNMLLTDDQGGQFTAPGSQLVALGLNGWKGWECWIGKELIVVHAGGDIFRANCKEGGQIGHITNRRIAWPDSPVICQTEKCSCLADIMCSKYKIS